MKDNVEIRKDKDTIWVELIAPYPDMDGIRYLVFDQCSTRASDGIRISYDYLRDGYVIEQASRFAWTVDDNDCDPDWQEVAFIQAWAREETEEEQFKRLGFVI